jgi:hypothetical protein
LIHVIISLSFRRREKRKRGIRRGRFCEILRLKIFARLRENKRSEEVVGLRTKNEQPQTNNTRNP